jgi:farnesyl-diphosphate farnesyltransferase
MSGQDETRRRRIRGSRRDLGKSVLEAVSRSFFLTIRVLPAGLRQPVALAYLLARASDTIADAATAPAEQRLEWLAQLGRAIEGTGDPNALRDLSERVAPAHPGERTLMARLGECATR